MKPYMMSHLNYGRAWFFLAFVLLTLTVGCSKSDKEAVSGQITLKDGTPVAGANVLFRSDKTGRSARGVTDVEGHYELSTLTPGDGIQAGKYYVTLTPISAGGDERMEATFNSKYRSPTQELIFEVEAGKASTIDMQLDPP